jgi:5-methylcytosine-specific restriction endonuclease McrA
MAHWNVDERRQAVAELIERGTPITPALRRELAERFGCALGTISSDTIVIQAEQGHKDMPWARYRVKRAVFQANRRAVLGGIEGRLHVSDWLAALARTHHTCTRCGIGGPLTLDHVIPLIAGGSNLPSNIQPLCQSCNSQKADSVSGRGRRRPRRRRP